MDLLRGANLSVTQDPDGEITAERPETEEKFRTYFAATGLELLLDALLLNDEEGKLGVLSFREPQAARLRLRDARPPRDPREPGDRRGSKRPALQAGGDPRVPAAVGRKAAVPRDPVAAPAGLGVGLAAAVLLLIVVPLPIRVDGPVRLFRRAGHGDRRGRRSRGGDPSRGRPVDAGDVIATLKDEAYRAALAESAAALAIAESDVAQHAQQGDAAAMFEARSRRDSRGHDGRWPKNSSRRPC